MKLGTIFKTSDLEGEPHEIEARKRAAMTAELRPARLEVARKNDKWTEIEDDLVPRGRGWFVSASTDAIYTPTRGVVFAPWSVLMISGLSPLYFSVDDNDDLVFYERIPGTWTEHLEKQAARQRAKAAAPPPRRVPAE